MFNGTDAAVHAVYHAASEQSRRMGSGFVGSEHLLLAAAAADGPTGDVLRAHGCVADRIAAVVRDLAGLSASVAADCAAAGRIGINFDDLLQVDEIRARLQPSPPVHRVLPLGWRKAQRRCAAASPPIAGDAQGACEAALWLALANWHQWLTDNHLGQVLLGWSRGSVFVADRAGVDRTAALTVLRSANPPRRRVRQGHLSRARALAA
jgi:Clp amino terminal domain, pathogenicity island component